MKDLPAIEATYTELATRLDRKLDAAREQGDGAAVAWAEKQQLINDSAYFILVWGQLEVRIDEVCEAAVRQRRDSDDWSLRRAWDAFDPDNLRVRFEDRSGPRARPIQQESDAYERTLRYYRERNRVAHGRSLATAIDVPFIISDLYPIASELAG